MLRIATEEDVSLAKSMLDKMIEDSVYKDFFNKEPITEEEVKAFTNSSTRAYRIGVFLLNKEGREIGVAAFETAHLRPLTKVARMVAVYIEPKYRGKKYYGNLIKALETWGREVKCQKVYLSNSNNFDLSKIGYKQYEVVYMKDIS